MGHAAGSYRWLAAGGAALGIGPPAAWAAFVRTTDWLPEEFEFTPLSDAALAALVLLLTAATVSLGGGLVAAVRLAREDLPQRRHGRRWLTATGVALGACVLPPVWFLSTPWMFLGCVLATRPVWWQLEARGPVSTSDARACLSTTLWRAAAMTIAAHGVVWLTVIAACWPVPPAEFARIDAERTARELAERQSRPFEGDGIDFIEMAPFGTIAAGRYVLGDMSFTQFTVGPWPLLGHLLVIDDIDDDPTEAESWMLAAIAFVSSIAFWTPWVTLFTWRRSRDVRLAAGVT